MAQLTDLGVKRGGRWLVRNINLSIERGEIVTVIGPNGSGKSTTVKALLSIEKPDEGAVKLAPGITIGYVPQKLAIDRTLPITVHRLMTLTGTHAKADIARALAATGIGHLAGAEVQNLSGGEFQRALIARAIVREPDLLILDEPVQGVDFSGEIALYKLIGDIRDQLNCGILLISHDLHIVMAATDTVICLNGHVCCSGTPQTVTASPEYQELFGPQAAETLAIYPHHHDHSHGPDGEIIHNHAHDREATVDHGGKDGGHA
ncbi:MAG: ATP-binding cassette domain-containing protein [Hyphomicrobiales bacterium]